MRNQLTAAVLAAGVAVSLVLSAVAQSYNGQPLRGGVVYVPVGTTIDTTLNNPIDSAVAKPGDSFTVKTIAPVYLGSDLVFPNNTVLDGMIVAARNSEHMGINGKMDLRLTAATTPDGLRYPLSATVTAKQAGISTEKDGTIKGRSTKATVGTGAARVATWAVGGTLLGLIVAPIVAGSVGLGAVYGLASGAGVGVASDLWRKGKDVTIPSGTKLVFQFDQPMSLSSGLASASAGSATATTH